MNRPQLPDGHPLREYSDYMLGRIDALYLMLWVVCFFLATATLSFTFFAVQKWWERQDLQQWRDEVRNLLSVIKGWTVINTATTDRAIVDVKEDIKKVPDKVVEAIKTDSGIISKSGTDLEVVRSPTILPPETPSRG